MADIAIMSMLHESAAIVSVNAFEYLYQFIYVREEKLNNLLLLFAINTVVSLAIEWAFSSVSLAIKTRYQNMAVRDGCLAKTMEATHFSGDCKCDSNCFVCRRCSISYFTW